jgi:hypothetical protein
MVKDAASPTRRRFSFVRGGGSRSLKVGDPGPSAHRATTSVVREPFPQNRWFLLDSLLLHYDSDGIPWDGLPSLRWEAPLAGLVAQLVANPVIGLFFLSRDNNRVGPTPPRSLRLAPMPRGGILTGILAALWRARAMERLFDISLARVKFRISVLPPRALFLCP